MYAQESYFVNSSQLLNARTLNDSYLIYLLTACNEILSEQPDGIIVANQVAKFSDEFASPWLRIYNFFFDVILVGAIILAGVTGDILSCLVLIKDRSHGTTSLLLTSLAICDTMFLIGCLFFQCLKTFSFYVLWLDYINLYAHICKILYGTGMTVRMLRNWTVVLISLERWVAVCKPLHAPSICTRKKARLALTLLSVSCVLYSLPNFFIVDAKPLFCHEPFLNVSTNGQVIVEEISSSPGFVVFQSSLRQWVKDNYLFRLLYRLIGYSVLIVFLPTIIIAIFNVLLVRGIKYANARRAQIMTSIDFSNQHLDSCSPTSIPLRDSYCRPENHTYFVRVDKSMQSRTGEVNRLCVGVIIIYLVCELPAVGYQVIHLLHHRTAIDITKPVTNALVCLNSGVNFFVYVLLGRRFRSQLKDMLRRVCCKLRRSPGAEHGHIVHSDVTHSTYGRISVFTAAKDEFHECRKNDQQRSETIRFPSSKGKKHGGHSHKGKQKFTNWELQENSRTQTTTVDV